ncbi:hypothetical protein AAF712_008656 [Marasmius tenuissimus]|uniref:Uncharacterized protein n=1 Tax=Marasmius tenuissimus TaxID=585030 RepID=A0ABR2ZRQ2_9AGAR
MSSTSASPQTSTAQDLVAQPKQQQKVETDLKEDLSCPPRRRPCLNNDCRDRRATDADTIRRLKEKLALVSASYRVTENTASTMLPKQEVKPNALEDELGRLRAENQKLVDENHQNIAKLRKERQRYLGFLKETKGIAGLLEEARRCMNDSDEEPDPTTGDISGKNGVKRVMDEAELDEVEVARDKRCKLDVAQGEEKE